MKNSVDERSAAAAEALRLARLYAPSRVTIIVTGATGTGKSHLVRRIHGWSGRSGPLTDITLGELDQHLARAQLFGHERGAFTGAVQRRAGLFTEAGVGTLFLDDFHNIDIETQIMLLRALDSGQYRPAGYERDLPVRCRLAVGVRETLDALLKAERLLPDLRYRLGRAEICLASLEERREDIMAFAEHFLERCAEDTGVPGPTCFARDVAPVLESASYPGNLRDLRSVVQIAYLHAAGARAIAHEHLPASVRGPLRFRRRGDPAENRRVIEWALWHTQGSVSAAARLIGAHRNTVSAALRGERRRTARSEARGELSVLVPS